jgi:hypothetical protein
VLTSDVPPERRGAWFTQKVREGVQVTISHPKIIETGIDLLNHASLIFLVRQKKSWVDSGSGSLPSE